MSKTKFEDEDTTIINLREMLDAANKRVSEEQAELLDIRTRIGTFYRAVKYVAFNTRRNSPEWADSWPEYLRTGATSPVGNPDDDGFDGPHVA